jgi:diguanylate cyclase (GGDEF)-like protein/PAS domain S-box-containing protein/putative nucleotidyltransferase with HDIG domain
MFQKLRTLLNGAIRAYSKRTVSAAVNTMGHGDASNIGKYHPRKGRPDDVAHSDIASQGQTEPQARIVEGSYDAIFSVDQGLITTWSRGAERLYGYSAQEAVGQMFLSFLWRSALTDEVTGLYEQLFTEANDFGIETHHFRKEGVQILVCMTLSLLTDAAGASPGMVVTVRGMLEEDQTEELLGEMGEIMAFARQKQEIENLSHQVEALEVIDTRTGLTNRRSLDTYLDQECQRAARYGTALSIVMLHIDGLKHYDETPGTLTGEEMLRRIALLLQQEARTTDKVACFIDELFCIVLPHTDREGALIAAERVREQIAAFAGPEQPITVSVGAATFSHTMENSNALIAEAEKALHIATQDGGNRVIHFEATWDFALTQAGTAVARTIDTTAAGLSGQAAVRIVEATSLNVSRKELADAFDTTIECWSRGLDVRDQEAEGHSQRVMEMTVCLAQLLGIRDQELVYIRWGALLHDVGKIAVPDSILLKPDSLTPEEWTVMRSHTTLAHEALSSIEFLQPALDIPCSHHERWDGTGYPEGLQGDEIPLAARIFAIVDVWDALRSDRPYRKAWSNREALDYIYSLSGTHFDPTVVRAFHQMMLANNVVTDSGPIFVAA